MVGNIKIIGTYIPFESEIQYTVTNNFAECFVRYNLQLE